jgi:putative flippase GtrA
VDKIHTLWGEHRALFGQLLRYAFTGGLASFVNIGLYHLGEGRLGLSPNVAWAMGFVAAMLVGYVIHSRWSFRGHGERGNLAKTGSRFFAVSLVSFALNSLWVWLMRELWHLPSWSPDIMALFVTPIAIFTLNRKWVFG